MGKKKKNRGFNNHATQQINNGLSNILNPSSFMGFDPMSIGTEVSQTTTVFRNLRWYLISNMRQPLSQIYAESGIVRTIVDVPVDDGMRGGIDVFSKQLGAEEIEELKITLDREDIIQSVIGQALKWNRLYGGAGVLVMTDQEPETPFDINLIKKDSPLEFRAVDMWELFWDKQNTEGYDPEVQEHEFEHYNYYAKKLHKSRVFRMKGITPPSFIRPRLRGWGLSVVEHLVRSINQYLKSNDLAFEVLDEFKIDVFKIKNLVGSLLDPNGEETVKRRIRLANQQKNYQSAIVMDGDDDYAQKQLSFAGISDIMREIRMQIASDMRMPLTKIFGISATGFNSGEDDIENYNSMIESEIRAKSKYDILRILEILCKKKFGFIPTDLKIEFKPLRMLSAEQEENVKTQKFNRLIQAQQAGLIDVKTFIDACNKENLLPVQVDSDKAKIGVDFAQFDPSGETAGVEREVSRKPKVVPGMEPAQVESPISPRLFPKEIR